MPEINNDIQISQQTEGGREISIEEIHDLLGRMEENNRVLEVNINNLELNLDTVRNISTNLFEKINSLYRKKEVMEELIREVNKRKEESRINEIIATLRRSNSIRSSGNISSFADFANTAGKLANSVWSGFDTSHASYIFDEETVISTNHFQEELIKELIGENFNEKGYNNNFLHGYNRQIGNYVIEISEFENDLKNQNIDSINSRALANYLLYLNDNNQLNRENLIAKFDTSFLVRINRKWNNESRTTVAMGILERNGILEKVKNLISISAEDVEGFNDSIRHVNDMINEAKEQENYEFFKKNQEYITYIDDKNFLTNLINFLKEGNDTFSKITLKEINKDLRSEFIHNENIMVDFLSINLIEKEDINTTEKLTKLINENKTNDNYILNRAVFLGIDKEIIKSSLENLDYEIDIYGTFEYINIYIGDYEKIEENNFKSLKEKSNNFENINELNNEEKNTITQYLLQNLNLEENIESIILLIKNKFTGNAGEFLYLPINDIRISKEILKLQPSLIVLLPKEHQGNKEIINTYISNETDIKIIATQIPYLSLSNINSILQIFKHLIDVSNNNKNLISNILIKNPYLLAKLNQSIKENTNIDDEYIETYLEFKKYITKANLIKYKPEIVEAGETFISNNTINSDNKEHIFSELINHLKTELKTEKINDLISVITSGKGIDEKINDLSVFLMDNFEYDEASRLFTEIIKILKELRIQEIIETSNSIDLSKINENFIINEDGIDKLNYLKINFEFEKYIIEHKNELEKLPENEKNIRIEELKNKFIENNFSELNDEEKRKIKRILNLSIEISYIQVIKENVDTYFEYVKSGSNLSFQDYAKENNINLNNNNIEAKGSKNIDSVNSNYTIENKNLSFRNNSGNSVSIPLNQNEQKLVKSNPEIIENIINFYNVLDRVGLSKLWNLKDSIFSSISNVEGIGFNIDGDYLNENEIKIFLNSILKSVGENQINSFLTLNDFIAQIEIKNNTQFSGNEAQIDMIHGDTYLEDLFIKKFAPRNSAIFNSNLFENSL